MADAGSSGGPGTGIGHVHEDRRADAKKVWEAEEICWWDFLQYLG